MKFPDTPVIWFTLLLALLLSALSLPPQLPEWLAWLRPHWPALFLIYWVMAVPQHVGLGTAWMLGLLLDALHGSLLGQQALGLLILSLLILGAYPRLRMYSLLQQAGIMLVLLAALQAFDNWLATFTTEVVWSPLMLGPALVSALLWPVVFLALRALRRYFRIA